MAEIDDLIARVTRLSSALDKRVRKHKDVEPYLGGDETPLPDVIQEARLTKLYRWLMPVSDAPWGSLIIDSKQDRLEVAGIRDVVNQGNADRIWADGWQANDMDAESKLAHAAALLDGRAYATVLPDPEDPKRPDIALDDATQMIVEFAEGSRRRRRAALRRWVEGERVCASLFTPDGIYKFRGPESSGRASRMSNEWEKWQEPGDDEWPLPNPHKAIPVELRVNGRLKAGAYPFARGEFEHCVGLINRIHLLTFLGLVVAVWLGFPLRGVLGGKIQRKLLVDDDGEPIMDDQTGKQKSEPVPPFEQRPDSVFQIEGPDVKLAEFKAADRSNLSLYDELQQLAVLTKTPRHYFPMEGGISNIGSETIMAFEGAMHAAVDAHKASMGPAGWGEVSRQAGQVLGVELSAQAEVLWKDAQARSLAERADAASKLKDVLPAVAVAEVALNATQDQISRWQSQAATDPLTKLIAAAQEPVPGNGVPAE